MRGRHGWDRRLDRLSSGIYENAVRLHRRELRQLAGRAAVLQFLQKFAALKAAHKAINASVPSVGFADTSAH
jgi:hypothetical protein